MFQNKGFEIYKPTTPAVLQECFMTKIGFEQIQENIKQLSEMDNQRYPWTTKIRNNVYEVLCYYCNGTEKEVELFRNKETAELCSIAQSAAEHLASDMSSVGHLLANIFCICQSQIFSSQENRKKYNNSLNKAQLKALFETIRFAPVELRKDASFAEPCIQRIREIFPDYELALAIYNQDAGLLGNPYDPQTNLAEAH